MNNPRSFIEEGRMSSFQDRDWLDGLASARSKPVIFGHFFGLAACAPATSEKFSKMVIKFSIFPWSSIWFCSKPVKLQFVSAPPKSSSSMSSGALTTALSDVKISNSCLHQNGWQSSEKKKCSDVQLHQCVVQLLKLAPHKCQWRWRVAFHWRNKFLSPSNHSHQLPSFASSTGQALSWVFYHKIVLLVDPTKVLQHFLCILWIRVLTTTDCLLLVFANDDLQGVLIQLCINPGSHKKNPSSRSKMTISPSLFSLSIFLAHS